jgi:hypothetical protein
MSDVFSGDWRDLPKTCTGSVEVWDQTVGCPECGMNIWNLPAFGQWPAWDAQNEPPENWWGSCKTSDDNPYVPYFRLLSLLHPFQFEDCHDPGDEDTRSR